MLILLICICWYLFGGASFVYWWTKDDDFTVFLILIMLFIGVVGPIAFIIGYCIHNIHNDKVLIRCRRNHIDR